MAADLDIRIVIGEANSPPHLAWLSQMPFTRVVNHRLPILSRTLLEVDCGDDAAALQLFATHLAPIWEAVDNDRLDEAKVILRILMMQPGKPHLLVGDFNALDPNDAVGSPPPRDVSELRMAQTVPRHFIDLFVEAGSVDCYRAVHPRLPGYTYPTDAPWARIDFIFASPPMAERLVGCNVITGAEAQVASDHFPIWAEFR